MFSNQKLYISPIRWQQTELDSVISTIHYCWICIFWFEFLVKYSWRTSKVILSSQCFQLFTISFSTFEKQAFAHNSSALAYNLLVHWDIFLVLSWNRFDMLNWSSWLVWNYAQWFELRTQQRLIKCFNSVASAPK